MSVPSGEELVAFAERGVRRALARGAEQAEVYASYESAARVEFRGRLGEAQETAEGGVCVRLATSERRTGFASVPGLTERSVELAIERALVNARYAPVDAKFSHYADPQPVAAPPTRLDARVAAPDADRLLGDAKAAADGVAGQADITYLTFQLSATRATFGVANSRGVATWDQDAREAFLSELRVSDAALHKTSNEFGVERRPLSERYDLGALLGDAAARARGALRTAPLERPVDTVVVDFVPTMLLLSPFLDNLAVAAAKTDGLVEQVGKSIASPLISMRDDPARADGVRCQRVDDEGVPTRATRLVERGVLRELPTHAYLAHQKGAASTGNGYRSFDNRWTSTPRPRIASLDVAPGTKPLADILAGVERGVYVRDYLLGWFTNNPVTGDFSTVAPLAFLVEKGSIVQALPPTTVAGNVYKMLQDVEEVSRERRTLLRGSFPALRVSGLTCAT
ncbi:MAG TPA: metallopeptidase TldD-related protein [Candidatus Thermoplasmatota archaeon]|nr:metallopeptidase TldD-related protein [Candidatus Thermoplasmatota archaeon]